jgi:hypothetical protein
MTIHEAIREAIRLSGRLQIRVAEEAFSDRKQPAVAMTNLLAGRTPNPGCETIQRIAAATGVVIAADGDGWWAARPIQTSPFVERVVVLPRVPLADEEYDRYYRE